MLSWQLHRTTLETLEPLWRAACDQAPDSFFQRFEPSLHWARTHSADGSLRVWVHEAGPALAAFTLRHGKLALLGQGLFDYVDLVGHATPPAQQQLARQLLEWEEWEQFDATGVPADSRFAPFWEAFQPEPSRFSAAPLLLDANRFLQGHPRAAHRLQLAQDSGWEVCQVKSGSERASLLQWILEQKERALRAEGRSNVLDHSAACWLQAMVTHEPEFTELWQLHRGEEVAAGLLAWRSTRIRYAYTISYSEHAAALSPGILLLYGVLRHSVAEGLQFDFLTGEQPFKLRFADARRQLLRLRKLRRPEAATREWTACHESGTEDRIC